MEQRNYKRIPVTMDLLFEDYVTPEQAKEIIVRLSEAVSNSKHGFSRSDNKLKEARFFVKGQILIQENFIDKKKSIEEL